MRLTRTVAIALLLGSAPPVPGAEAPQRHTLEATAGETPAVARLADLTWLVGHWRGEGFSGTVEEVWLPPEGGAMLGTFRLVVGGAVRFYEIMTLVQEGEHVSLRLKHFHPDLVGWEENVEVRSFRLLRRSEREAHFDGMSFRLVADGELEVWVAIRDRASAAVREVRVVYRKVAR